MTDVMIPTSSGKRVAVAIHAPEVLTNNLAILCPGFLDSKDYKHLLRLAEQLQKEGYTVARIDPLGTWASEGDIEDYTTEKYLDAIKSVKDHLLAQHPYQSILIAGHSRGGRMAVLYATQDKAISKVVAIMPSAGGKIRSHGKNAENNSVRISKRDLPDNPNVYREFAVPNTIQADGMKHSAVEAAPHITASCLFLAGEQDDLIPPAEVESIYEKVSAPKELIVIPGIGHDFRHNETEIAIVNNLIIDWLKRLT